MTANILDLLDDPNVFKPHFKGPSWDGWKAFLAALFALPLTDAQLVLYRKCTGRTAPPTQPFSEAALIIGRRGGKSRALALVAVTLATTRDYRKYLAPGEAAVISIIAVNKAQARSIFRFCKGLLEHVPLIKPLMEDANTERITLSNNVIIEISAASFRTIRGVSAACILVDEIAFLRTDEDSANPDRELLRAARPALSNIPDSLLLIASSPYGKKGELYNAYRKYHGKDDAKVLCWMAPTEVMNPKVDKRIIAEAFETDPQSARSEYGSLSDFGFRDDLADFVTREMIDAVTMWGRRENPPMPGITYQAFMDPSGGMSDSQTVAIGHLEAATCVLDALLVTTPPFDPEKATAECAEFVRRYSITRVVGDKYAGQWVPSAFSSHGIQFEQSARPKSDLYLDLLPLINSRSVELLEHPRLASELIGLERRTARSRRDSVDHSPGGHDDVANAVAGLCTGLYLDRRPALVRRENLLTENKPHPLPVVCRAVIVVLCIDKLGNAAVVFSAITLPDLRKPDLPRLLILDFFIEPSSAQLFTKTKTKALQLQSACHGQTILSFVPEDLVHHAHMASLNVQPFPKELGPPEDLLLSVSHHVNAEQVKLCEPAAIAAQTTTFHGALDLRAAEDAENPLRAALIYTAALTLDPLKERKL